MQHEWPLAQVSACDVSKLIFGAKTLCLLAHVFDQLRSLNTFGETGKIFDQRGDRKLATGLVAFDDERLQIGACAVKSGCMSRAAGAMMTTLRMSICLTVRLRKSNLGANGT